MKKVLLYVATAILLGTVTMLAPAMLLKSNYYGPQAMVGKHPHPPPLEAETLDRGEALRRAISPSNLLSAGLMLIPSFLLALGVSLHLKKRIF